MIMNTVGPIPIPYSTIVWTDSKSKNLGLYVILGYSAVGLFLFCLLLERFFSRLSTDLNKIWHECVLDPAWGSNRRGRFLESKKQSRRAINIKIGQNVAPPHVTFSLIVTKRFLCCLLYAIIPFRKYIDLWQQCRTVLSFLIALWNVTLRGELSHKRLA